MKIDRAESDLLIHTIAESGESISLATLSPNPIKPVMKGQNRGIEMGAHDRSKSQTSGSQTARLQCICCNDILYQLVFSFHVCSEALIKAINQTNFGFAGKIQAL
jgi:hypothetical protein